MLPRIAGPAVLSLLLGSCAAPKPAATDGVPPEYADLPRIHVLERTAPKYPVQAARAGVQGCVSASFDIRTDGLTDNFEVIDSEPEGVFVKAALLALRDWRFARRDAPVRVQQIITFSLTSVPANDEPDCETDPSIQQYYLTERMPGES